MAFLLAGVALGATAVALSESDRNYYQTTRLSMDYLGNKNGLDIYKDRVTGFYYADDGWEVRRVGKPGWRPDPVDLERLKLKLTKYSPKQLPFAGYILATYIDREQALWDAIFRKFEYPKEPKKPHFSRSLRKQRWAKYDEEYEQWEKAEKLAKQKYRDECAAWNLKKKEYNAMHENASSGQDLLRQAFSSGPKPDVEVFKIVVPQGKQPGDTITVAAGGRNVEVMIPPGSVPGTEIQFELPRANAVNAVPTPASQPTAQPMSQGVSNRGGWGGNDTATPTASVPVAQGASAGVPVAQGASAGVPVAQGSSNGGWRGGDAPVASAAPPAAYNPFDSANQISGNAVSKRPPPPIKPSTNATETNSANQPPPALQPATSFKL